MEQHVSDKAELTGFSGQKSGNGSGEVLAQVDPAQLRPELDPLGAAQRTFSPPYQGMLWGYARVSRGDSQTLRRQIDELEGAGVPRERIFTDELSGARGTETRPGFTAVLERLRPGDVLLAVSLDRVSRSLNDLMATVDDLVGNRGVTVRILNLGDLDPSSPLSRVLIQVLGAVAELERSLISSRTRSGLEAARKRGAPIGRPKSVNELGERTARSMREAGASVAQIGQALGVSERTVRRIFADS